MRLATVRSVRSRMLLPDIERINDAIEEILDGVTDELESDLRTEFAFKARQVDLFYLPDSMLRGARFSERLYLSRGLVTQGGVDVSVVTAPRRLDFLTGVATDVLDLRDTSEAAVEHADQYVLLTTETLERGIVTIQDFRLVNTYVQVTYDAGLAVDRKIPGQFLQSDSSFSVQGSPNLTFADADPDTITRDAGDWSADGFRAGDRIRVSGSASNNGTYVVDAVSATVLTLSSDDALTAEGPSGGISVEVVGIQSVPAWLKELARLYAMLELTSSNAVAGELQRETTGADRVRPKRLEASIEVLLDKHVRYEPGAVKPA